MCCLNETQPEPSPTSTTTPNQLDDFLNQLVFPQQQHLKNLSMIPDGFNGD